MRLLSRLERISERSGGPDSRVVVVLTLCLILLVRSLNQLQHLAWFEGLFLLLSGAVGVRLGWLLTRSCLVLPFTLAAVPLLFTVKGEPLFTIFEFTVSREGLTQWTLVVCYTWICYQVLLTAAAKVGPFGFLDGLAGLGLPTRLVSILRLALRYLDVMLDEASRLRRARTLRAGVDNRPLNERVRTTGAMVGTLFLRSLDRAHRIQVARRCRGGGGSLPISPLPAGQKFQIFLTLAATCGFLYFYVAS